MDINTATEKPNKKPQDKTVASFHAAAWKEATVKKKKTKIITKLKRELKKLQNRTFTTGFLFDECKFKGQETRFSHTKEEYEFVGEVIELNRAKIEVHSSECNKPKFKQTDSSYRLKPELQFFDSSKKIIKIKVHNALFIGDRVEFIQPKGDNIFCKIKNIYDNKSFEKLKSAHGGQERMVYVEVSKIPEIFSVMRKRLAS